MAKTVTPNVSNVTMQDLINGGINAWAIELLVESYASPKRLETVGALTMLSFVFRGVHIVLSPVELPYRRRLINRCPDHPEAAICDRRDGKPGCATCGEELKVEFVVTDT
jgi:hypothetical protein